MDAAEIVQEVKAKVKALVTDLEAAYGRIETAIKAHNEGTLDPAHLEGVRDSSAAAITNAKDIVAEPQGSPVPDGPPSGEAAQQAAPSTDDGEADATV